MDKITQLVTIGAVLLGGMSTYAASYFTERTQHRRQLLTRWDEPKLSAYSDYVGRVRACIYAAVLLYERREGIRSIDRELSALTLELADADGKRMLAFERVMLLAGDPVIAVAHELNAASHAIDWQARGAVEGTLAEWRAKHRAAFAAINRFHEAARADLGVAGAFAGDEHSARDLILPPARPQNDDTAS